MDLKGMIDQYQSKFATRARLRDQEIRSLIDRAAAAQGELAHGLDLMRQRFTEVIYAEMHRRGDQRARMLVAVADAMLRPLQG